MYRDAAVAVVFVNSRLLLLKVNVKSKSMVKCDKVEFMNDV
jgi:hypothetical protein